MNNRIYAVYTECNNEDIELLKNHLELMGYDIVVISKEEAVEKGLISRNSIIYRGRPTIPDVYLEPTLKGQVDNRPWYNKFDNKRR